MTGMRRPQAWQAGGASLVEFVVAGAVVAILAGVLLQRLSGYQQQAEGAALQRTLAILHTAVALKAAALRGQGRDLAELSGQNPMRWLSRPPGNYVGELTTPIAGSVAQGQWYFDRKRHLLVYLLNFANKFPQGTPIARHYQVKLIHRNNSSAGTAGPPTHAGIALVQVDG
jgi:general secretion pathway protein G